MSNDLESGQQQERALISSKAFDDQESANGAGETIFANPAAISPFIPARWGKDAMDLLGDDSKQEAMEGLKHLSPEIDRTQPIQLTNLHRLWGPSADQDGKYYLVMIADITYRPLAQQD